MQTNFVDQLIYENNQLFLKDIFGDTYALPNLTAFINLYHTTSNPEIQSRIKEMLSHDLGTLLVIENMIDPTHEVTLKRLENGDISKNMKHVMDYYVVPKSHFALARFQYEHTVSSESQTYEASHFAFFPYGQVILRANHPNYHNPYTDTTILQTLL